MTNQRRAALHKMRAEWRSIDRKVKSLKGLEADEYFKQEEVTKELLRAFTSRYSHNSEVMLVDLPYEYFKIYLSWASSLRFKEPWQVLLEINMQLDAVKQRGEL